MIGLSHTVLGDARRCCPRCRTAYKDLLPDIRVANGSVVGAFLVAAAPELIGWSAVGLGWIAGGLPGVAIGVGVFVPLVWLALRWERKLTVYSCFSCGRRWRFDELAPL
ncbi:MAG TPA: hypothetical protein VFA75_14060 [Nevskia sp.]|nr:hypothetical protein [Nevskia sp.]